MTQLSCLAWDAFSLYQEMEKNRPGAQANTFFSSLSSSLQVMSEKSSRIYNLYALHCKDDSEVKVANSIQSAYAATQQEVKAKQEAMKSAGVAPGPSKIYCVLSILNICALWVKGHTTVDVARVELARQAVIYEICFKDNSQKEIFMEKVKSYLEARQDKKDLHTLAEECSQLQVENKALNEDIHRLQTTSVPADKSLRPAAQPISPLASPTAEQEAMEELKHKQALQTNEIKALHAALNAREKEISKLSVALDIKTKLLEHDKKEITQLRMQAVHHNLPLIPPPASPRLFGK